MRGETQETFNKVQPFILTFSSDNHVTLTNSIQRSYGLKYLMIIGYTFKTTLPFNVTKLQLF